MKKVIFTLIILPCVLIILSTVSRAEEVLTWEDCVKIAEENHPDLISAKEAVNLAKASVGISRSSMLPQVDATASAEKSRVYPEGEGSTGITSNTFSYGLSAQQLLFDGGQTRNEVKSAELDVESRNLDYIASSASVRQNLRYSFVQLLGAQESVKITAEILKIRENNLQLVRMRYKAGLEHKGSLLTAEANLSRARLQASQAQRNLSLYRASLINSMGLEETRDIIVQGDLVISGSYSEKPDYAKIAASNPELKSIIQQRLAAEYDIKSAKADYYPKIYGVLNASRSGEDPVPDSAQYSAGVQMSFNIFQGGKSHYQTEQAEAAYRQLFADEKSTQNTVKYYLEQAWINLQGDIETIEVQNKFLEAAVERAKIADAQYSIGSIEFDSWTLIQDNLVNAKEEILNAQTAAMLSEADWIYAKGGTLTNEEE